VVEYYFGYALPQNDPLCEDWRSRERSWDCARIALDFLHDQRIPFAEMEPADGLVGNPASDDSRYALAKPDELYLVYLPRGGGTELDLGGARGRFAVAWFDPRHGGELQRGSTTEVAGERLVSLGTPPLEPRQDWLAVVQRLP
jgi:hypothetical protein